MAKTKELVIPMDKEEEGSGGRFRVPDGDYRVKILGAKYVTSKNKNTPGLEVHYVVSAGKYKGKKFNDTCYLTPKALWRVRSMLEAVGIDVPKKAFKLNVDKLKGKELGVTFTEEEDEYEKNGQTKKVIRSNVSDFLDLDALTTGGVDDDEDEDDEDVDDDELDDDEEDDDEDPLADLDRDELKAYIKKNKLDVKPKKSWDEDKIREAIKEAEGDDDDDLEELDVDDDL